MSNRRWWLQTVSFWLLVFAVFAPLSEALRRILLAAAFVGIGVYLVTDSSASRKWHLRSLIPIAAFILLGVLFSFDRTVLFLGVLGIWTAMTLWELYAEYFAQRDRR